MTSFPVSIDEVFRLFSHQTILVIGDLMLDRYIVGKVNRISPEAPVPVLEYEQETCSLGGACNVALNLKSLGADVVTIGVVGQDEAGSLLMDKLTQEGLPTDGIINIKDRMTTEKTRIMAGGQQLLRLDKEVTKQLSRQDQVQMVSKAIGCLKGGGITGLVFQDYNKGVLNEQVISAILAETQRLGIPVTVDPKHRFFWSYKGVDIFKPNLKEVVQILGYDVPPKLDALSKASNIIRERLTCKAVLITLSERGIFYDDGLTQEIVTTKARVLADPCGAGDTVISMATLALTASLPIRLIAQLANLAGGQVVENSGVVAVNREQLFQEALQHKILG
jgi:rfaE bifunctional protein kinase chain/domain